MRLKRVFWLPIALLVSLSLLAGCAGGGSAAGGKPSGDAAKGEADKPLTKVIFVSASASQNPLFQNIEVGKPLGYYKEEGIDVEFQYLGSNAAVMSALLSDKAQVGVCTQDFVISYVAQGNPLNTQCYYEYTYPMKWDFAVPQDSPVKSIGDLKGKTLGLISLGTADESIARQWISLSGLDPKDVNFQVVGDGMPAAAALIQQKRVDAMLTWDTTLGTWDQNNMQYRVLPRPQNLPLLGGFYLQAPRSYLESQRNVAVGFARAVAKGSIFAVENPKAAAELYVQMHPEAVGQGQSKDDAIKGIMTIVKRRSANWAPPAGTPWGQMDASEWTNAIQIQGASDKVTDPNMFFTKDLIADINKFDPAAIKSQAQGYTVK